MTQGVLMYAHNNTEIDYFKIACANALMVKKNLGVPVTLVTDPSSLKYSTETIGEETIHKCFDNIVVTEQAKSFVNKRSYQDTASKSETLQFYNCNHWEAYSLSPYDETLFIDADYLIMSDALSNCWGSSNNIMINHKIVDPGYAKEPYSKFISDYSIRQYWATVIYFKKSAEAEAIFSLVKHVQENYAYYRQLYYFPNGMFRNDFAFSIALHMMNGFVDNEASYELPISGLLMIWDTNDIHSVPGTNDIVLYTEKYNTQLYTLTRLKNQDVHIMNKWAINRVSDKLIELYK